jgi:hypothetical protein
MSTGSIAWTISLAVILLHASLAQGRDASLAPAYIQTESGSKLQAPLLAAPLHLSDFDAMAPRPELRSTLLKISGFIQNSPYDGQPASEDTEVWLGYTRTMLYFVFVCHDRHPDQIRGHLARRENIQNDDNVSVILDPFQDRRKGVLFSVNPAGVQSDATWTENNNPDYSYDQVWDSEGRVTLQGWMALVAIPFRSLRFRPGGSDWGVVFQRNYPRNSETDYWPRVAASVSGVLTQEGTLGGISGVSGSHNVQINPYSLGQNERALNSKDPTNPYFSSRHAESTGGGELKAILKDSIVIDATVNPDFSDVESDQPQFTVDQRFPVYFPELRPFFLENANYFATPITLLYTRKLVQPQYGSRVTGKLGNTNFGLLAIDDREPGQTVSIGDALYNRRAKAFVARFSQDIGKGSSIGSIFVDREFGGGWNRIGGIDFTARMDDHWTATGQWVESSTRGTVDSGTPPAYSAGPAFDFQLQRSGHAFNMQNEYQDFSSGFETRVGYIQSSNIRSDHMHANYQWYLKHSVVQSIGLETNQNIAFDHQGNRVYHYSTFDPFVGLPRNIVLAPLFGQNSDTVGPQNDYPLDRNVNFTENFAGFVARGAPLAQLNFNLQVIRGGNVNYNPVDGSAPFLMDEQTVQALFTLQPQHQLTIDNTYLLDRNHAVKGGAFVYESQTMRSKVNYQFTRSLSARVVAEYDSTLVNPSLTSLQRTRQVATQALITWLPHPGTAIYIGYSNDMQNLDRSLCNRISGGVCDPDNTYAPRAQHLLNDGRQMFIKASYLFRF